MVQNLIDNLSSHPDSHNNQTKSTSQHPSPKAEFSGPLDIQIDISVTRKTSILPTPNVVALANMFGLGIDENITLTIVPPTTLHLCPNELTFITGPSGSGKSSILSALREKLTQRNDISLIDFNHLPELENESLTDCLAHLQPKTCDQKNCNADNHMTAILRWLSLAGLSDAFTLLRRPDELSDGQRYRFKLAHMMGLIESLTSTQLTVILADEFGATLDRLAARIIASNLRRWISRCTQPICVLVASSHDDLLEPLAPDTLIDKQFGSEMNVTFKRDATAFQ
jgi:hypothetical protein